MARLVSPGVSVTVTDESFFIPAAAPTVPLIFIATADEKMQPNGTSPAEKTYEYGVVRTVDSLSKSVKYYGIPRFLTDYNNQPLHGDCRNEYGLFALNQFLGMGTSAFVVRAYVNLNDDIQAILDNWTSKILSAATLVESVTTTRIDTYNSSNGYYLGGPNFKTTVTEAELLADIHTALDTLVYTSFSFRSRAHAPYVEYYFEPLQTPALDIFANGYANAPTGSFEGLAGLSAAWVSGNMGAVVPTEWSPEEAGQFLVDAHSDFMYTREFNSSTTLGNSDAQRRQVIVQQLNAMINSNTDIRSEQYEFNLILCPGYHECTSALTALMSDATAVQEEALVIGDPPMNQDTEYITNTWGDPEHNPSSTRIRHTNVAYYYPHGLTTNLDGAQVYVASSGTALRTITYSDNVSQVWFAPAGTQRGRITDLAKVGYIEGELGTATTFIPVALSLGERNGLYQYPTNLNPIALLPGRGLVVFGQKTADGAASALDRVGVRRLIDYIKRQLRKNTVPFLFEPNDRLTRANIKSVIDGFLGDIMTKRGLYDFATICDETNNTPETIDMSELYVDIALKPVKAVEFIYIPIRVVSTGTAI